MAALLVPPCPRPVSTGRSAHGGASSRILVTRIIRTRLRPESSWSRPQWYGCRFSFEGAVIESADLSKAQLLQGGHMTFHGARFTDYFDMRGFRLYDGAPLWFTNAIFEGDAIFFKNAVLTGSKVHFDRAEFKSGSCTFEGTQVDAVEDIDAESITTGMTRVGARQTGATLRWGTLPPLP